ncbi:hypothetical protein [uncultured Campylobacter sp.]|uniref:hypothetical protein n=1 Tax=uncultured Campylobacter sp. TaxID=218934 RepID=UPI0028EEE2B3|nr:hypothetical protein [uncultured Campylobacter sp.]
MWLDSKKAAEILGIKYDALQKATNRATKKGKKFCRIRFNIINFNYIDGNIGGAAGKTLQIWIDDDLINDKNSEISQAGKESRVSWENDACARLLNFTNGESDGYIYADTKLDARDSVDIRGANGGVFGAGFANTSSGRDQEQTQINSNQRTNDANRGDGRNQGSNYASDSSYEQYYEQREARTYSRAYEANGIYECANNEQRGLWLQSGGEERANSIAVKDEAVECEVVEQGGLNLPATLSFAQSKFASASEAKKELALIKKMIIDEWNKAKGKIKEVDFIEYINAKKIYPIKLTANKLYAWQRAYKAGGIDALIDDRTSTKECEIERLGLRELAIKLIHAQRGRINSYNIYKMLNYHAVSENLLSHDDFQGKKDEIISYEAVNRFVKKYLKANPMLKTLIEKGEDGVISKYLSAMGKSNWAAYSINQIVEIDASPLDIICSASDLCDKIGFNSVNNVFKDKEEFKKFVEEWQQRYTIIGLIDTYSGVASFHVTSTENSSGIARATAKYILRYGKPQVIKGDNGKAFKSKANFSFLGAIGVEYKAVKAYSGWLKPYVEKNFGSLQNGLSEWLKGFIGHNINQRQAIEFFFSKKERRLKKGFKTNLKDLNSIDEINSLIDDYSEKFLNNRYLDRLGKTCREAYNEKVKEAEPMNALELSLYLAQKQDKCVLKQGVSVDGVWFSNEMLYNYSRVFVRANLDNVKEQFVFDENDTFVCIATPKDLEEGSSVEAAKAAQKIVHKRVKALKEKSSKDRAEVEAFFTDYVKTVEASRAVQPATKGANDEIVARIELDHAQRKSAELDDEYMKFAAKNKKKKEKEILGFEAMAQAKFKAV